MKKLEKLKNVFISYSYQFQADDLALVLLCSTVALITFDITIAADIGIMYCLTKIYGVSELQNKP